MKIIGLAGNSARDRMEVANLLANVTSGTYHIVSIASIINGEIEKAFNIDATTLMRFNAFWGGTKPRDALKIAKCHDADFIAFAKAEKINIYLPKSLNAITKLWGLYRRKQDPDYFIEILKQEIHDVIKQPFVGLIIIDVKTIREAEFLSRECRGSIAYVKNNIHPTHDEMEKFLPFLNCIIDSTTDKERLIEQVVEMKELLFLEDLEDVIS